MAKNATPLLLIGGAAFLLMGKKKKRKKKKACPSTVSFESIRKLPEKQVIVTHETGEIEVNMHLVAFNEISSGNRDLIDITKKTLAPVLSPSCATDPSVTIALPEGEGGAPAPLVFAQLAGETLEDAAAAQLVTGEEAGEMYRGLEKWMVANLSQLV